MTTNKRTANLSQTLPQTNIAPQDSRNQATLTPPLNRDDLTIVLAQTTFRVGDILGNAQIIKTQAEQAKQAGADIIVFPELALTGYPPEDLLLRPSLVKRTHAALDIIKTVTGIVIIFGYSEQNLNNKANTHESVQIHPRYNAAAILLDGKLYGSYHKQCLPNYSVFDEARYFSKGTAPVIFTFKGKKIGLLICEDLWHESPIEALKQHGTELLLVLNASPFEMGKQQQRKALLIERASKFMLPIAYVNIVGAQDDLVFDGGSMTVNANGELAFEAERFIEQQSLLRFDVKQHCFINQPLPVQLSPIAEIYQALVVGVRDYVNNSGFNGVVLGLSGGIDSALTLAILVDALGAAKVNAVMMPYTYTANISIEDAAAQAERLGVGFHVCEIHEIVNSFTHTLAPLFGNLPSDTTEENLQARSRGVLLMALSNKYGHLVITTGNKSEMAVGYATLYGDMVGGYAVLKDVYKTQVFELAKFRNSLEETPVIPPRVIARPPSAELRPDQKDEDSLPPYDVLDAILRGYVENDMGLDDLVAQGFAPDVVRRIIGLVDRNEYKRKQSAPGTRVSNRSFTRERRYPLVNGWQAGK